MRHTNIRAATTEIEDTNRRMETIRTEIANAILALPDNPKIQRLSDSPRCFTMSSKELFGGFNRTADMRVTSNWTVRYHDFKTQYREIADMMGRSRFENIVPTLRQIVTKGHAKGVGDQDYSRFHPQVRRHLANLLGEPELLRDADGMTPPTECAHAQVAR